MSLSSRSSAHVATEYHPVFRELGLDAEMIFHHPLIQVWRKLQDRENCLLDTTLHNGQHVRWHIKRFPGTTSFTMPVDLELRGNRALLLEHIPTAKVVAWGKGPQRSGFIIYEDLAGFAAADKLIESGVPFDKLLIPTADLAAKLHNSMLHHRDLYLCHFFAKVDGNNVDVRLIDPARVKRLPKIKIFRTRWIVKDLAQFWYSSTKLPVTDEQRIAWFNRYCDQTGVKSSASLERKVKRKVARIAKHDAMLNRLQPNRNVSIPN